MSKSYERPTVPEELGHLLDERVLEIHNRFAFISYEDVLRFTVDTESGATGRDGQLYGRVAFGTEGANDPEAGVLVLAASYQQAWKPSKAISTRFAHDVVNPDGVTVVLPNNSGDKRYYEFTDLELARMDDGDLTPFYEKQLATVEGLIGTKAIGEVTFGGFSQGALVALGMAAVGSDRFSVARVNSFELPSEERTPKKLKSDFTKSGSPYDQVKAIKDSALPALSESLSMGKLAKDYFRFALDSTTPESKAIMAGMATPAVEELTRRAIRANDDINITLGFIEGSKMKGDFEIDGSLGVFEFEIGEGSGSHKHATSDNIVANALMMQVNRTN